MQQNKFHCPRCRNVAIIEYDITIECPHCNLEFEKKDLDKYTGEKILSIEEKKIFIEAIKRDLG